MGTWGADSYENDTALDWASETGAGPESIEAALDEVIQTPQNAYLDADAGCIGVAACEALYGYHNPKPGLLARLFGGKGKTVEKRHDLIAKASKALKRVAETNSELAELWEESEDNGEGWHVCLADLEKRLKTILE